jgi:cyclophilin family peptidyl-prolyl cis-trans isomerase
MRRRALFLGLLGASLAGGAGAKPPKKRKLTRPLVTLQTSKGAVLLELYPEEAPLATQNFIELIRKKFYDGLTFHRIEDFVAQGGDPKGDGTGGPGYAIKSEVNAILRHGRGALGMANSGRDTAGSQFYIVKKDKFDLDEGFRYTLFGKVTVGMDVVDKLALSDKILTMTVETPQMGPTRRAEPDNLAYPILPDDAARREFVRSVRVRARIGVQGGAAKLTLVKSSGDKEIDAVILEALGAWRWSPALIKGEPVPSEQEFVYDLATHSRRYDG